MVKEQGNNLSKQGVILGHDSPCTVLLYSHSVHGFSIKHFFQKDSIVLLCIRMVDVHAVQPRSILLLPNQRAGGVTLGSIKHGAPRAEGMC